MFNIIKGGGVRFMSIEIVPEWMENLDDEDITFIKKFILASGSLKEIAKEYNVTYPTVRLRLDKLIQKIQISEDESSDPYIRLIKRMAINDKVDFDTAKILINEYKRLRRRINHGRYFNEKFHNYFIIIYSYDFVANIFVKKKG